jgi:hypothetical protein
MLLMQDSTITKQDMGISVLEVSRPTESKELIMDEDVLNSIYLLYVIYDIPTCCYKKSSVQKKKVPIVTPIPMKPSGQKEKRETSP